MRASSWLYQYSSQSKFTYGVCSTIPPTGHSPVASISYVGPNETMNNDYTQVRPPSSSYVHEITTYQNLDEDSEWSKERTNHVKQEPIEANQQNYGVEQRNRGQGPEEAEPVDMSINSNCPEEHGERQPGEFCPCSKAHINMVCKNLFE